MSRRKTIALMLAAVLVFTAFTAGCKKDKEDASNNDFEDTYTQDEWTDEYEDEEYDISEEDDWDDEDASEDVYETYGPVTEEAVNMMLTAFQEFEDEAASDPVRVKEVTPESKMIEIIDGSDAGTHKEQADVCTIEMGNRKMQYIMEVLGDPGENGKYPLYITLHGGGGGEPEMNNEQWLQMTEYYRESVDNGIYVAVRGMEDVWNLHFLDDSYPMYDRLIEDMILMKNADPNRVYLLGFSAGGDGVYAIAPRMADRFAAVNMSSGHPNGVSLLNTSNLPFEIQVGIRDFYSEDALRSVKGAEFEKTLNEYHDSFGYGYPHRVLVHVPEGHNYNDYASWYGDSAVLKNPEEFASGAYTEDIPHKLLDFAAENGYVDDISSLSYDSNDDLNASMMDYITNDLGLEVEEEDTNAIAYVNDFVRDPSPDAFVWDLGTRANRRDDTGFYWLGADYSVDTGTINAAYEEASNTVFIEALEEPNGDIKILASPFMMDFDRPLTIVTGKDEKTVELKADKNIIDASLRQTGDLNLAWACEINVSL